MILAETVGLERGDLGCRRRPRAWISRASARPGHPPWPPRRGGAAERARARRSPSSSTASPRGPPSRSSPAAASASTLSARRSRSSGRHRGDRQRARPRRALRADDADHGEPRARRLVGRGRRGAATASGSQNIVELVRASEHPVSAVGSRGERTLDIRGRARRRSARWPSPSITPARGRAVGDDPRRRGRPLRLHVPARVVGELHLLCRSARSAPRAALVTSAAAPHSTTAASCSCSSCPGSSAASRGARTCPSRGRARAAAACSWSRTRPPYASSSPRCSKAPASTSRSPRTRAPPWLSWSGASPISCSPTSTCPGCDGFALLRSIPRKAAPPPGDHAQRPRLRRRSLARRRGRRRRLPPQGGVPARRPPRRGGPLSLVKLLA